MKNLNGKFALITGGSSGIGLALACKLFASGMSVAILARAQKRLAEALEIIEKSRQTPCKSSSRFLRRTPMPKQSR
jgi:3-dehydrosphinganine reductase